MNKIISKKQFKTANAKLADQALGTVLQFLDHIACTGFQGTCTICERYIRRMGALREAFSLMGELK